MSRTRPSIGCAVLATAAITFPAGLWVAGGLRHRSPATHTARGANPDGSSMRNPYSATIRNDPHVLNAQRAVVEAMERACRQDRAQCAEAAATRRSLDDRIAEKR